MLNIRVTAGHMPAQAKEEPAGGRALELFLFFQNQGKILEFRVLARGFGIDVQKVLVLSIYKKVVEKSAVYQIVCDVLSGVPQGLVLGLHLFLLYVNDLPESITSECCLFADDTLFYNTRENKQVLQRDLDMLG